MKYAKKSCISLLVLLVTAHTANAWHLTGQVKCPNGSTFKNVTIEVVGTSCQGAFSGQATTDSEGLYSIALPDCDGTYCASVDPNSLPAGATASPAGGGNGCFNTTVADDSEVINWDVSGAICDQHACWFTGGGAKLDPLFGLPAGHKGKWISFGGNVNPGCSPTAGDGGNWNHVDRISNIHFQGRTIQVLDCGNVTPPPTPDPPRR